MNGHKRDRWTVCELTQRGRRAGYRVNSSGCCGQTRSCFVVVVAAAAAAAVD